MIETTSGAIETVEEDIGVKPEDTVRRWRMAIEIADKGVEDWHKKGTQVVERYRDEKSRTDKKFNILWANTEILKASLFAQPPKPDVRRRVVDSRNPDPVGRIAAETIERALSYSMDDYDFEGSIKAAVEDYVLPGMGTVRVRYVPTFAKGEPEREFFDFAETIDTGAGVKRQFFRGDAAFGADDVQNDLGNVGDLRGLPDDVRPYTLGEARDEVVYEEAPCEHIFWKDFRWGAARQWRDVPWVAFRWTLRRDEMKDQFPEHGAKVPLTFSPKGAEFDSDDDVLRDVFKRGAGWEIWDRDQRKVIVIADGYDVPVAEWDDPLGLRDFFPVPEPMIAVSTNDKILPVPLYCQYQDQAMELDVITNRISMIVRELKVRGVYDGSATAVASILTEEDGKLIGVDNYSELAEKGGLSGVISFLPLD